MFCYRPKHCFRLFEGQQSASWRINFARFRCGDRIRTRDSRTPSQNIKTLQTLIFQQALQSVPLTLKITQQQFGSRLETLGAIQPYILAPMPNSQKQTLSFFVETFSTKTLDVENTHSKEPLNMIHICWTNLILLAVTKLEITSTFFSVKLQWNTWTVERPSTLGLQECAKKILEEKIFCCKTGQLS